MWWTGLTPVAGRVLAVAVLFATGVGMWFWKGREAGGVAADTAADAAFDVGAGRLAGEADAGAARRGAGGAPEPEKGAGGEPSRAERWLAVHVAGAVERPGVYRLPTGARVEDAVYAAGGAARGGRPDVLNLAAPLEDGVRVYVPSAEEVRRQGLAPGESWPQGAGGGSAWTGTSGGMAGVGPGVVGVGPEGSAGRAGGGGAGRVDVNRATEAELDALPGIGPALARRIVEYRRTHGPFRRVEDLLEVPGIGPAKLQALRPLIVLR